MKTSPFRPLLCLLLLVSVQWGWTQSAVTPNWEWYIEGDLDTYATDIAVDHQGFLYSLGWVETTASYPFSQAVFLNGQGSYLLKHQPSGAVLSTHTCLTSPSHAPHMAVDQWGNAVLIGIFSDSVDLDLGPGTQWLYASGTSNFLIYQLDTLNQIPWARAFEGTGTLAPTDIRLDAQSNLYLSGNFQDSLDADPGPGEFWLTTAGNELGIFLIKLTPTGDLTWATALSDSVGTLDAMELSITPDQECYVMGTYRNSVDFDPGAGTFLLDAGIRADMFILKLTPQGDFDWVGTMPKDASFYPVSMTSDPAGEVIFSGILATDGTDVDPGPDSSLVFFPDSAFGYPNFNLSATLVCKWSGEGEFRWVKSIIPFEGASPPAFHALTTDPCGAIYGIGSLVGEYTLDPTYREIGTGDEETPPSPEWHNEQVAFIKLLTNGTVEWLEDIGQQGDGINEIGVDIALNPQGKLITAEDFSYDWRVHSYSQPSPLIDSVQFISACESYVSPSGDFLWDSSGVYLDTITTCYPLQQQAVEVHLTINSPSDTNLSLQGCAPFFLNGETYTTDGTYVQVVRSAAGCDSTIFLDLTILPNSESTISSTTCEFYTFHGTTYHTSGLYEQHFTNALGCDSTVFLDLTILPSSETAVTAEACEIYTLNGISYETSGTYEQHFTNAVGCDSTLTLELTVYEEQVLQINAADSLLYLQQVSPDYSYQWLDCDQGDSPISGATGFQFPTDGTGSYAVVASNGLCSDTSDCFSFSVSRVETFPTTWQVFPNPSDGWVQVSLDQEYPEIEIRVFDLQGKELSQKTAGGRQQVDVALPAEAGVYLLEVRAGEQRGWKKVVRQ